MESGSLEISESQTSECVSVVIVADVLEEPDMECFIVSFSSASTSGLVLSPSVATVCINDGVLCILFWVNSAQASYSYKSTWLNGRISLHHFKCKNTQFWIS